MKINLKKPKKISARHGARKLAVQGLYAWHITGNSISLIEQDLLSGQYCSLLTNEVPDWEDETQYYKTDAKHLDVVYFQELIHKIPKYLGMLDTIIVPHMSRKMEELGPIEYVILLVAIYEFKFHSEIPVKVVLNEAIELAKEFGGQDSHKFINGVLDKVSKEIHLTESKAVS